MSKFEFLHFPPKNGCFNIKDRRDYILIQVLNIGTKQRQSPHLNLVKRPKATPRQPKYLYSKYSDHTENNTTKIDRKAVAGSIGG